MNFTFFKIASLALLSQTLLAAASNEEADAALLKACTAERNVDNVDDVKIALEKVRWYCKMKE